MAGPDGFLLSQTLPDSFPREYERPTGRTPTELGTATWDEFKQAFSAELGTLPDDTKRELEKLETTCGFGPRVMQMLLKFVEMRHEQAQGPEEGGFKVAKM
jgi:hypothetical protein